MVGQKRVAVLYPQGNECINKNVFYFYLLVVVLFAPRIDLSDVGVSDFFGIFFVHGFPFVKRFFIMKISGLELDGRNAGIGGYHERGAGYT